ncbi:hypothetical protein E1B28_007754 [Marasmius oreades]|uniref:Nitrogen regulatory protein areA GATA-like domain-containing protein n=1 Tax=Marasmius oreades TaxID=181124 RepID=A0A9P7UTS8_9AGAR|nr:uncharacterized protein E1B28_007754 [Marasmius oreades]KAG7094142.1 hypothetical protein E1B28_007754 [Marasmius oreades]
MANYLPVLMHSVTAHLAPDDSSLETLPRGQVDYLSHDWREEDVWRSWRNMTRQKNEITNGMRLENASWRTWWKQRNNLQTVNPETLNWLKDSDVTWLYGPLHTAVEWTPPPKPTPDVTERQPASAQDRLDLSLPKQKSILKYRTISELLTSELPSSPPYSPSESDGEADAVGSNDQRRPSLPHTRSDTHITRWGPDRTFRKDSPPRVEPPGSAGASTPNSDTVANSTQPTPTRISSSSNLTSYFSSHLPGHQSHNTSQTSSSTSNSASASPRGASSELSAAPAPKKKHITFNTFVEQCIAIDKPKGVIILGNGSGKGPGKGMNGSIEDTDEEAEEHDDGYDEDVEGGDDFDPDWGLNECAITDSDSEYEEDVFIQDNDDDEDEDEGDSDNDGVIEMRASRKTNQDKVDSRKVSQRSKSKASTSSSSSADSASSPTSNSLKIRRSSIPTIPRRRRSGTLRTSDIATARPSFNHGPRRNTSTSSDQMVTIAPIPPTMLKTGGSNSFAYPAHYPAWDGFGVHPDTSSRYGGWMDSFGDDALSEDGGFGAPMGRYSGYSGWRSSGSESPGTPVELVYMPLNGRYGATYSSRGESRVSPSVNSEEAEVELMEEAGEARRLGREEHEEHVQTSERQPASTSQQKPGQPSRSQEDDSVSKGEGQVHHHQEAVFSTVNSNSSKSHEREKKSKRRPISVGETPTGLVPSVSIVVRTPPVVQRPRRNSDDEEEDAYDYFGGPDLGGDYATQRTARRHPKGGSRSSSKPDDVRKSRSRSRSKSRTPSPQPTTPAIAVPGRNYSSSSSALLSPPLRGRGSVHHQSSLSPDSSSRGRSSTRTSSSSMSDRERPRSRSNHSSPIGSLSPDGSAIGLNYGVYANGRIGDRERERERDRERAHRIGGRGRERTERRLTHSLSPDSVEGATSAAASLPSSSALNIINSPSFQSSETTEGTSSTSSSQTILPPSPPSLSPRAGSRTLDSESIPIVPMNSPVISFGGATIAVGMDQNGDRHGRTSKGKLRTPPLDVTQPHISSPKTSFSVDPSAGLTSKLTSNLTNDSVLPDGSLNQHVIKKSESSPMFRDDDAGKGTRGQATTTSDDSSVVGKAVGNIMSSARAYLGLWNSGEKEKDDS